MKNLLALFVFALLPTLALAKPSQESMLSNLDFVKQVFSTTYAPTAWKARHLNWNLDAEINAAKDKVLATEDLSLKGYQRILKNLFRSTKDYHVGVYFHGTERSYLPFTVKGAEGRYFIVYIDRAKLSREAFPFSEGDELLSLDGEAADAVVKSIRAAADTGTLNTDQSLAELRLTNRSGVNFEAPVKQGPAMLEIKRRADGKVVRHQLSWNYLPENIPDASPAVAVASQRLNPQMIAPLANEWMTDVVNPYSIGMRVGFLPNLGERIWETGKEKLFDAYIYRNNENKLIGYVRIPNYGCSAIDEGRMETKPTEVCLAEFADIMAKFEKTTDALVIDQQNNPGGSVFYLYALASTLTDQPLYTPKHRMTVNQEDILEATTSLPGLEKVTNDEEARQLFGSPTIGGYPVTYQMVQLTIAYYRFLISEFKAGRTLTNPYYIMGVDQINPHPKARYTKPVLLLTNGLDFSGGDFFPAILQDNKRITVMGTRTAGAGGYVLAVSYPNLFGISNFRLTGSLAERIDQNPIENLGVTPDVHYEITANDLQNGFADYRRAIEAQINLMTK